MPLLKTHPYSSPKARSVAMWRWSHQHGEIPRMQRSITQPQPTRMSMKLNLRWVLSKEYSAITGISPRTHMTFQRTVTSLAIMTCCQSETVHPPRRERTEAAAAAAVTDTKGPLGSPWSPFQNCGSVLLHPQVCHLRWMLIYLVAIAGHKPESSKPRLTGRRSLCTGGSEGDNGVIFHPC